MKECLLTERVVSGVGVEGGGGDAVPFSASSVVERAISDALRWSPPMNLLRGDPFGEGGEDGTLPEAKFNLATECIRFCLSVVGLVALLLFASHSLLIDNCLVVFFRVRTGGISIFLQ